jgi:hypothetical protein
MKAASLGLEDWGLGLNHLVGGSFVPSWRMRPRRKKLLWVSGGRALMMDDADRGAVKDTCWMHVSGRM